MKNKISPPKRSRVLVLPQSADQVYARAFDTFTALLASRPAGDALKIQLMHYLPATSYGSRDVLGWTLSGALVGLLAHSIGGNPAQELRRTRAQGLAAWMPVLAQNLDAWDALILAHTATAGWQLIYSEPISGRVAFWEHHDGKKFEEWTKACNVAARIQQQRTMAPLNDPLFREVAHNIVGELKVMLGQLRSQSLASQKRVNLREFFQQQAERGEFGFLNDAHTLRLWLEFCERNPKVFLTESPNSIFDLFQSSVSGQSPDYVRQTRARG